MHRITIVGSGFAALSAVQKLRASGLSLEISVVSPRAEFVFYPGLIWLPSGIRQPDDLRIPLTEFFRRMQVDHRAAEATGLRDGGRTLDTTEGEIANDGLIMWNSCASSTPTTGACWWPVPKTATWSCPPCASSTG